MTTRPIKDLERTTIGYSGVVSGRRVTLREGKLELIEPDENGRKLTREEVLTEIAKRAPKGETGYDHTYRDSNSIQSALYYHIQN